MRVRPLLDALPNSWFESIQQKTIRGTPDLIGCINGGFVAIEFKSSDGDVSKLQEYKLNRIAAAGGFGIVVSPKSWKHVYELLKQLATGEKDAEVKIQKPK